MLTHLGSQDRRDISENPELILDNLNNNNNQHYIYLR